MEAVLRAELARLGKDPAKTVHIAPGGEENRVFNLTGGVFDPDGPGGLPPDAVMLRWTERCVGDYDQNGEVGISDLTPLGQHFHAHVIYSDPSMFDGVLHWPWGSPVADGGAGALHPPEPGSGAENWRLARIDGDDNGELNISDITPIATHWGQRLSGYIVMRKRPGEASFTALPNPDDPASEFTIPRSAAFFGGGPSPDPNRPLFYSFMDTNLGVPAGIYEYMVIPLDGVDHVQGINSPPLPLNMDTGRYGTRPPIAILTAEPSFGPAPLTVEYSARDSYDPDGLIVQWEWAVPGFPGGWFDSGLPTMQMTHTVPGLVPFQVRVSDADGMNAIGDKQIGVT